MALRGEEEAVSSYQMRLPEELSLGDLAQKTAIAGAAALRAHGLACEEAPALAAVRHVFERHLGAFDTCGCSNVCDEQVSPSGWNLSPDSRLITTTPGERELVHRYHLRIARGGLDKLATSAARYLIHGAGHVSGEGTARAEEAAAVAFRDALGPYIFDSELCRHNELCRMAEPVELWGHAA